jgi:hypothetical protein
VHSLLVEKLVVAETDDDKTNSSDKQTA